jgi:hypothetical protein
LESGLFVDIRTPDLIISALESGLSDGIRTPNLTSDNHKHHQASGDYIHQASATGHQWSANKDRCHQVNHAIFSGLQQKQKPVIELMVLTS